MSYKKSKNAIHLLIKDLIKEIKNIYFYSNQTLNLRNVFRLGFGFVFLIP